VWKLVQEVGKDKSSAFLNETSDNPYSSSSGAAYDFYSLNRLKAAGGKSGVEVTNSPASMDKSSLFLRCWIVNPFGCRTDYHNEKIG